MASKAGYLGSVSLGTMTDNLRLNVWEINSTTDSLDVTSFGNQYRDRIPGLIGFSGSAEGFLDGTTNFTMSTDASVLATFIEFTGITHTASIIITSVRRSINAATANAVAFTFDVDGAVSAW